ncbi:hypothetical protein C9E88_16770 [Acinetobacter cumulans]|jgi:uncharacterized membrane protein|uniref:hypothetical protein n=1 Tax=Acinetobacter cumulans TaxID=2136182 RepID=UPI000D11D084|nr:hypothetical protein [Acinetobacter cumulans]QCO23061.1 hypothetical protein C9E88_016215 [Acinetobacter cumulans]QFU78727.1 hypothetical protein C9E88_16770 [Acinetobacter cumulans]
MKILAVILCMMGCLLLYFSHRHQNLLQQSLRKHHLYIGLSLILVSLIFLLMSVLKLVAVYMWLMTLLVVWSLIPFVALFKKNIPHEISRSTKNPS